MRAAHDKKMIYIVRHGESISQKEHLCIGRTDLLLSESGARQIKRLGNWFSKQIGNHAMDIDGKIYTSPLSRCYESARLLANEIAGFTSRQIELVPCDNLQEISMGVWDGLSFCEIKKRYPEEYRDRGANIGEFCVEKAETYTEAGERFLMEMKKLAKQSKHKDLLLVAHAGVVRAAICLIEKRKMKNVRDVMEIRQPNAGITQFSYHEKNGEMIFQAERIGFRPAYLSDEHEIEE